MRKTLRLAAAAAACGIGLGAADARAGLISPDDAFASSAFSGSYLATNTIDGSGLGLPGTFGPTDAHAAYASGTDPFVGGPGNHWTTDGSAPLDEFIVWTFDAPKTLTDIHVWNHQSNGGLASNPGYDVTLFSLGFFASDDATGPASLGLGGLLLAPDTATGQSFALPFVVSGVRSVRFDVDGVQSSPNYTGLAEVLFSEADAAVPLPAGLGLLALGLGALGLARRRRG